jgi:hypothetical protein
VTVPSDRKEADVLAIRNALALARHGAVPEDMLTDAYTTLAGLLAVVERYENALRHYAEEAHWSLEPDDGQATAYYPMFTYDGGNEEPWKVARAALGTEESA